MVEVIEVINDEDLFDDDNYNQVEEEVESENMNGDQTIENPEVVEVVVAHMKWMNLMNMMRGLMMKFLMMRYIQRMN